MSAQLCRDNTVRGCQASLAITALLFSSVRDACLVVRMIVQAVRCAAMPRSPCPADGGLLRSAIYVVLTLS